MNRKLNSEGVTNTSHYDV